MAHCFFLTRFIMIFNNELLASHEGGINIGGETFNVFAYADGIFLANRTPPGLQKLIVSACRVENNGLCFNPKKRLILLL